MPVNRREFLRAGAAQTALVGLGVAACAKHPGAGSVPVGANPFRHGIASGDPLADRVILWTRVSPRVDRLAEPVRTDWWMAADAGAREIVRRGRVDACPGLEDYRRRHAQYKSDPDLQAAHARHPWITIWDDHESADNSHRQGARDHDSTLGDWQTRKLSAIRAYYEWMPIRELPTQLFRSFRFGTLVDLVMLDTRLHGRDEQIAADDHEAARNPSRSILGEDQTNWLLDSLSESKARGSLWRVVGQQVIFSPFTDGVARFNPDSWDGYRENRASALDHLAAEEIDNVVFLTGDVHSSWAFEVPPTRESGRPSFREPTP